MMCRRILQYLSLFTCVVFGSQSNQQIRHQRQTSPCTDRQFTCKNQECIAGDLVCDGTIHCQDGSDETFTLCSQTLFTCPQFAFRCAYGACVDGDSKCNGVKDCADNSDELLKSCNGVVSSVKNRYCKSHEFACLNKRQCIPRSQLCDGAKDCQDGSDETITQCLTESCESFAFRCAYGACVDGDYRCDGVQHCADGSDEYAPGCNNLTPLPLGSNDETTTTQATTTTTKKTTRKPITTSSTTTTTTRRPPTRPTPTGGCLLPESPANGEHSLLQCSPESVDPPCDKAPGTIVPNRWYLRYECNPGYHIKEQFDIIRCVNGEWSHPFPRCLASDKCQGLKSDTMQLICLNKKNGKREYLPCSEPVPNGTVLRFHCINLVYQPVFNPGYSTLTCQNGQWNNKLPELMCKPACGLPVSKEGIATISNGKVTEYGEFPWHAGVYHFNHTISQFEQVCGGTIVSPKVVISAAHCFMETVQGELILRPLDEVRLAVGKYRRDLDAPEDEFAKVLEISDVRIPGEYIGATSNYQSDIAVVITIVKITYTYAVRPICLDIGHVTSEHTQLQPGGVGKVVGWGGTEKGRTSDVLLVGELPFVPLNECKNRISPGYAQFISLDKFCAGGTDAVVNVCPGDSGGGLVFQDSGTHRYYLRGIVSIGTGSCSQQQFGLFTKLSQHSDFIQAVLNEIQNE